MKDRIKKFIPSPILNAYHSAWPALGDFLYRHPSGRIKVIGITGTNGKTSDAHLCSYFLENEGHKTASTSAVSTKEGKNEKMKKKKMIGYVRRKEYLFLRLAVVVWCEFV